MSNWNDPFPEAEIGNWVSPKWAGHQHYGQTGQIIDEFQNQNGVGVWRIDVNGDGESDYTVNQGENKLLHGSQVHQGFLASNFDDVLDNAAYIHNIVVPVIVAVVSMKIYLWVAKHVKRNGW